MRDVAAKTKNYTGAELQGLVKNALDFALDRLRDKDDITKTTDPETVCVTRFDFDRAIAMVRASALYPFAAVFMFVCSCDAGNVFVQTVPAFGSRESDLMDCYPCVSSAALRGRFPCNWSCVTEVFLLGTLRLQQRHHRVQRRV